MMSPSSPARRRPLLCLLLLPWLVVMLPACESPGADGPPGSASERAASLLRSFSQIRSFATVEDPFLLGQALGVTIRMDPDRPDNSIGSISDDPRVPNGSWRRWPGLTTDSRRVYHSLRWRQAFASRSPPSWTASGGGREEVRG